MIAATVAIFVFALAQQASCRLVSMAPVHPKEFTSFGQQSPTRTLVQIDNHPSAAAQSEPQLNAGQYIVFFKSQAGPANVAARLLVAEVTAVLTQHAASKPASTDPTVPIKPAGQSDGTNSNSAITILKQIGDDSAGFNTAAGAAAAAISTAAGIQAVVVRASRKAVRHIRRSPLVQSVIQDREIFPQQVAEPEATNTLAVPAALQAVCIEARYLTIGITASASSKFKWPRCRVSGSKLIWKGRTCGDGSKILYTQIRSVRLDGSPLGNCVLTRDPRRVTWTRQRFGACGVQPTFTTNLPARVCSPTGGNPGSPSPPPNKPPPPLPTNQVLPRVPVAAGEQVTANMQRIEAVTAAGAVSIAGLSASQQITVAVVDSGIDGTHPDLNVVGGKSWATPSATIAGDAADPSVDYYGHGTHVAGIIGAKNMGQGVVGVVPNMPLYSLKIFNGLGKGTLSNALDAVRFSYSAEGKAAKIGVINLSIAFKLDTTSSTYQTDFDSLCAVFREASDNGILVAASAGNYASSVTGVVPANCPTVLAVTSIDVQTNAPSPFSNYLPTDATAAERSTVIAAPGSDIYSTFSYQKASYGYVSLSGTSMSSPHVAGVAAACIMSGSCPAGSSGVSKATIIQAGAQQRLSGSSKYGFTEPSGKYYGRLVWAGW